MLGNGVRRRLILGFGPLWLSLKVNIMRVLLVSVVFGIGEDE